MDVGGDDSLLCRTSGLLRSARDAFCAQDRFGFFQVAAALDESTLAIHESGIGLFTELLDEFWFDFSCCVHKSLELLKRERVEAPTRLGSGRYACHFHLFADAGFAAGRNDGIDQLL